MLMSDLERLSELSKRQIQLTPGEHLFRQADPVRNIYLLREGAVKLVRFQPDGREFILHTSRGNGFLAEASVYAGHYHCDGVAMERSVVHVLPAKGFLALLREDLDFAARWAGYLSHELQASRFRIELLTMRKVHDRLDAWLEWNSGQLPPKGSWRELAAELGVAPEALYRDIARRRNCNHGRRGS